MLALFSFCLQAVNINYSIAQSYTTSTKSCGKCGKQVSNTSKIGDRCPHCGVVWGRENTTTSSRIVNSSKVNNTKINSSSQTSKNTNNKSTNTTSESNATKYETETWILEKLRKYTPERYYDNVSSGYRYSYYGNSSGWYYQNYRFSFDSYNLVIEYEIEYSSSSVRKYQVKIPIYDIDRVYGYTRKLCFTTKNKTMNKYDFKEGENLVNDYFSTEFKLNAETDLSERLHKAFIHLKKFYKKPVSSEKF